MADYDFVVDLSNVCRSEVLGAAKSGASLSCLRAVSEALADELGGKTPNLYLVADDSLWRLLVQSDGAARVDDFRMRQRSNLTSIPFADRSILQYAEAFSCPVLSMDNYRDWRGVFPWIQGNRQRFFGWRKAGAGIEVYRRTMAVLSEDSISKHEERRHLGDRNLDPNRSEHAEILGRMYRCDNKACELQNRCPEFLMYPPRKERRTGQLICTGCEEPVTDVGLVGPVRQFRYEIPRTGRRGRFTIYQGEPVLVGRRQLRANLDALEEDETQALKEDAEQLQRVSSNHLQLLADNSVVRATDLGSSNGTDIMRWDHRQGKLRPPERLVPDAAIEFYRYDLLVLAGSVVVRWSGRRYRFDGLTQGAPEVDREPGGTQIAGR